jgi:beta-glucosidase
LIAAGFDPVTEGESYDRTFALPWGQESLIRKIAAVNPKTIVTLTAGGAVATGEWIDRVPAVLHNWYPGQEGGRAMAEILTGQRSPEGKLPISFEKSWEQNPVKNSYYPDPDESKMTPSVRYSEGVFLGYRYYTTRNIAPLFPFGFGLSYTTFSFRNLQVVPAHARAGEKITVSFDVVNTGTREGAEVAQLYLGDPSARVERPVKELKGFQKVRLKPGENRRVTLTLDQRALSYWSNKQNGWRVDPGQFLIYVGNSSADTPLKADFTIGQ